MKACLRSRGQASTEYVLVLGLTVIVLVLSAIDPSPIAQLIDAIKSAYQAFSYVMSYSI